MVFWLLLVTNVFASAPQTGSKFPMGFVENLEVIGTKAPPSLDWKGKVVLVDFWATWCEPCKKAIPAYGQIQKRLGKEGFVALGVNLDDELGEAKAYLAKTPAPFRQVFGGKSTALAMELESVPVMYLIDRKGLVSYVHFGFKSGEERDIEKRITALLRQK